MRLVQFCLALWFFSRLAFAAAEGSPAEQSSHLQMVANGLSARVSRAGTTIWRQNPDLPEVEKIFREDIFKNPLRFNGTDTAMDVWRGFDLETFTLAAWVREGAQQNDGFADLIDTHHLGPDVGVVVQHGHQKAHHYRVSVFGAIVDSVYLRPSVWQHFVLTRDAHGVASVFVDGAFVGSIECNPVKYQGGEVLRLGGWGRGGRFWRGELGEFNVYNRALSREEVRSLYLARAAGRVMEGFPGSSAESLEKGSAGYAVRHWTTADGLPSTRVQCVHQSRDGYVWVGTRHGLARFDGATFRVFSDLNARCITEDRGGAIWLGTARGEIIRIEGAKVNRLLAPGEGKEVLAVCPRKTGGIWVVDGDNLLRAEGDSLTLEGEYSSSSSIYEDRFGRVWLGGSPPTRWDPETRRLEQATGYLQIPQLISLCFLEDSRGRFWAGGQLFLKAFQQPAKDPELQWTGGTCPDVGALAESLDQVIWAAGSAGGLYRVAGERFERFDHPDLRHTRPCALAPNREGGVWVATEDAGLFLVAPKPVRVLTKETGLAGDAVWSTLQAHDGSMWVAGEGGVTRIDTNGVGRTYETGLVGTFANTLAQDVTGRVWVGTGPSPAGLGGLSSFEKGAFTAKDFPGFNHNCLLADPDGTLWIIGGGGYLTACRDGEILSINAPPGLSPEMGFLDRKGDLWLGGPRLWRKHGDEFTSIPDVLRAGARAVVHEDEDGALWLATEYSGVVRYKDGKFKEITTKNGLASDLTLALVEDDFGRYWFNSHNGIFAASKKELNEVADGRRSNLDCFRLGLEDGVLSAEGNGGNWPNTCKAPDGSLWFPTTRGVVIVDPRKASPLEEPPLVAIEEVRAEGQLILSNAPDSTGENGRAIATFSNATLRLPPGRGRRSSVRYSAPYFGAIEKVRYRYRLVGRDTNWIEAGLQRTQHFENLTPGQYRFEVLACNPHGIWNTTATAFAFYVTPFLYETWTFRLLASSGAVLLLGGFIAYRFVTQRRILQLQAEARLLRERERLARDIHDDLGAALARLALLSDSARASGSLEKAAPLLERIGQNSRALIASMGELIWSANPRYDSAESLAAYFRRYALEFFEGTCIQCELPVPAALPHDIRVAAELRRHLLFAFKEALANIARHSRATLVTITLRFCPDALELTIADNGTGFDSVEPAAGNGLENIRRRVEQVHGSQRIESGPGGTTLHLSIPLR